ncbi:hypothetical protein AB8Z38_23020 [Bradyrhizobium sp. LLZ17]|uniref:Uncharacterized protein n=1 Tax=Bradyrhizobium sp. LLZ17 TaxID=3239388 RepID=A0AB39XCA1_9BRAD
MRTPFAQNFARANGWTLARHVGSGSALDALARARIERHPPLAQLSYYRLKVARRPAAIAVHNTIEDRDRLREIARGWDHLRLHEPSAGSDASWYAPGETWLQVITRPQTETIVWPAADEMAAMASGPNRRGEEIERVRLCLP